MSRAHPLDGSAAGLVHAVLHVPRRTASETESLALAAVGPPAAAAVERGHRRLLQAPAVGGVVAQEEVVRHLRVPAAPVEGHHAQVAVQAQEAIAASEKRDADLCT